MPVFLAWSGTLVRLPPAGTSHVHVEGLFKRVVCMPDAWAQELGPYMLAFRQWAASNQFPLAEVSANHAPHLQAGTYIPAVHVPSLMEHFRCVIQRAHLTKTYLMWMQRSLRMSVATRSKDPTYWYVQGQDMVQAVVDLLANNSQSATENDLLWSGDDTTAERRVSMQAKVVNINQFSRFR